VADVVAFEDADLQGCVHPAIIGERGAHGHRPARGNGIISV
jgi:hypothetical protein